MTCIRYMPTLRTPVFGSFVITAGSVMNGAGSPGQQRWIGSRPRSTSSPSRTTSWHAPLETVFGSESATDFSLRRPLHLLDEPRRLHVEDVADFAAASSSFSTPSARHMRRSVPNWLIRSGCVDPFGFSNSSAGPPRFDDAIDDLGDLEVGVGLGRDTPELALALEERDPLAEVSGRRRPRAISV